MSRALGVSINIGAKILPSLANAAAATERRLRQIARSARAANAESRAAFKGMQRDLSTFNSNVSLPAAAFAGVGARAAYEWSKVGNEMQAVTQMSDKARKSIEDVARSMPGNPTQNLSAALDLARTGFNEQAIMGSLGVTIKLGKSDSSVDQAEAADIMTNVLKGMKMPDKTFEDIVRSSERVANNIAYGAAKSSSDVRLMGESFKYAAPMAARMGLEIEDLTGFFMTMADNGIKGSEAGVAFRSGLVRMIKPTKGAMGVLARYNMDLADYVTANKKATATDIVATLKAQGIAADGARDSIQALMNDTNLTGAALIQKISEAVAEGMGAGADATDLDKISDGVMAAMTSGVTKVDFAKFIQDGVTKGWGASEFANFFDVRQGTRLSTLWSNDAIRNIDAVKGAMERLGKGEATFLDQMYLTQMKGAVGPWEAMKQGFGNLIISMAESGVMDTVAKGMNALANGMMALSKSSPGFLRFITWAILGIAVMAPLGFALAGAAAAFRLLFAPLRLLGSAWRFLFSAVGAAGPRIPLILRLSRAFRGLGAAIAGLPARAAAAAGGGILARFKAPFIRFGGWIARVAGGWGGAIVRGLMIGLAPLAGALAGITAPMWGLIALIGAAFAGVAAFIYNNWEGIGLFFSEIWNGIKAPLAGLASAIGGLFRSIGSLAYEFAASFGHALAGAWARMEEAVPALAYVRGAFQLFGQIVGAVVGGVIGVIGKIGGAISGAIGWIGNLVGPVGLDKWRMWGNLIGNVVGMVIGKFTGLVDKVSAAARATAEYFRQSRGFAAAEKGIVAGIRGVAADANARAGTGGIAGARAKGGPVKRGLPYLVGERGPEIVVPGASGTVIPNHHLTKLGRTPKHDAPTPSSLAFKAMLATVERESVAAAVPVPNPFPAAPPRPAGEAGAPGERSAPGLGGDINIKIAVDVKGAREPEATGEAVEQAARRAVERAIRQLANRQAALLSD